MPIARTPLALAVLAAIATGSAASAADGDELYHRAIGRAIEQARGELIASRDLYVDHSTWADPWVVESEHYSVRTTASRYLAAKIANDLEYMLGQFQQLLGTDYAPRRRYPIWILPTLGDYNNLGGSADEHSSFYGSFLATDQPGSPVATYVIENETLLGMWITHTALHQYVRDAFNTTLPTWISEGLASYFALFWDMNWGAAELSRLIAERRYVRLSHLTRAPISSYLQDGETRLHVLGMFFNYLLHHHPDTRQLPEGEPPLPASFADYLRRVVRGQSVRDTGFAALVSRNLDQIEAEFRGYDFGG